MKKMGFIFVFCLFSFSNAQEVDCDVTVDFQQLPERYRENVSNFERQIEDYLNNIQWTESDWENEKIPVSINIIFINCDENFRYQAQVFFGSQRKIFGIDKNTIVVRILDDKWNFPFLINQQLIHNENRFEEVTSFLDFYMHLILGFDFDSYENRGGSQQFQKCLQITNLSSPTLKNGWDATLSGNYNRVQLVNDLLSATNSQLRESFFNYHYNGLDLFSEDKEKAFENILSALEKISLIRKKVGGKNVAIKFFFDAKYLEVAELFFQKKSPEIFLKLNEIDPLHQKTYDEYIERLKK